MRIKFPNAAKKVLGSKSENRILKIGKSLCVGDVLIYSVDLKDPVAHASLTYSIPPKKSF